MLRPLLHLLTRHAPLVIEHAQGYAELVALETARLGAAWRRQVLLASAAMCLAAVAATLGGTATLLWAVTPPSQVQAPWALWLVPLVSLTLLLAALACLWVAQRRSAEPPYAVLLEQLQADGLLLQAVARA